MSTGINWNKNRNKFRNGKIIRKNPTKLLKFRFLVFDPYLRFPYSEKMTTEPYINFFFTTMQHKSRKEKVKYSKVI